MSFDRFRIGYDDGNGYRYFEVRIFIDRAAMAAHYRRSPALEALAPKGDPDISDAEALVAPRFTWHMEDDDTEWLDPRIGYVLLHQQALWPIVTAHEMVHAGATYYRVSHGSFDHDIRLGRSCGKHEEHLADVCSKLWRELNLKLHERGYWGTP